MSWPEVTIVVCTYDRPVEIRATIAALVKYLKYPNFRWLIADDGTKGPYVVSIVHDMIAEMGIDADIISATHTDRKGWGVNVNTALRTVKSDYVYFTEDDYVLKTELDLTASIALCEAVPSIGMVRYGISGHQGLGCYLRETDISHRLPQYKQAPGAPLGVINYWEIERTVSDGIYAFYKYSNRPHLKHRRFHQAYGEYPEGISLARTEDGMNHMIQKVWSGPAIVCPVDWVHWNYDHIGESRQDTEADLHATS